AMRNEARLAFHEEPTEHLAQVAADTPFDQETREVRTPDHCRVRNVPQRPFVGALDAGGAERFAHLPRTRVAPAARSLEARVQCRIGGIDAQTDDVDGFAAPAHRDLDTADECQVEMLRLGTCLGETAEMIVVGKCEQVHPALMCKPYECRGC